METNYHEDKEKQAENMVNEEYFHEFLGCAWGVICVLIAFAIVASSCSPDRETTTSHD